MSLMENIDIHAFLKEYFKDTYKPEESEYCIKMKPAHLKSLSAQLEFTITHQYVHPDRIKELTEQVVKLNNVLIGLLGESVILIKQYYDDLGYASQYSEKDIKENWESLCRNNEKLREIISMLQAIEKADPKQH